ncbi:Sec1-like protein [Kalmanozyma brasiliensis GHG001]|uniref:Vesicle trafficking protein Sec1 n=1 Tax=Kalmanozyma brasiliensis (strain GHG001) TaxID=1365824 RepID=V5EIR4_KALBG|nr:Sec1-like protein [Kalmanozyma brasiliensis GHG001]EST04560.1 Sec1-like protein [Kalmanozyma brasiliensis GHG001]
MPPKSLVTTLRDRYLNTIRSVQPPSRWKVLVIDSFTKELLSSVLKMYDILQENVAQVDNIELSRAPQSTLEACYLLTPTSQNVDRIIQDLAPSEPGKQPTYAAGHIFFVDSLSDALVQKLTSSKAEPKLRQLLELYTNFWPTEAQAFSLKSPQSFLNLFQPVGGLYGPDPMEAMRAIEDELQFSTQAILNVCVTLNEFPLIRYYNPSHPPLGPLQPPAKEVAKSQAATANAYQGSVRMARLRGDNNGSSPGYGEHFTKKLAFRVQAAIDQYMRDNEPKVETSRPRGVLFITDRSMDTVAPFLHEFSYQAMCNDLLPVEDGTRYHYTFYSAEGEREEKEAILSDEDNVWTAVRHLHIAEAIDKLTRDFKRFAEEQGAFADPNSSLNDMRDMLASLPHMQDMKDKLSLHLTMAQACMNKFEKSTLSAQAMVEQNCATRLTPDGAKPRTLVEEMVPLLDDRSVSNTDKVRIIALYIMYCDGVPDEDRKRLFQHARLGRYEMQAVDNLVHLGTQVVKDASSSGWDMFFKKGKRKQQPGENEFELSRYQPLVKLMVEDHFAGRLEQATYPYVRDAPPETATGGLSLPVQTSALARVGLGGATSSTSNATGPGRTQPSSLRSAKPTWHQKGRGGSTVGVDKVDYRQRILLFVAGGMTYSEMRSAYQISERLGKDVYIGSSHTFTPESFVDVMKHFGKAGARDAARGAHHAHHHHQHQQPPEQVPASATKLSKPVNDRSAIRTTSLQHGAQAESRTNGGPHRTGYASATPAHDQGAYDRRFQTQPQPQQQQQQQVPQVSSIPQHLAQESVGRSASPAPSQASDMSMRSKEKKRLKNVFGFKKS